MRCSSVHHRRGMGSFSLSSHRLCRAARVPENPNADGMVKKEAKFRADKVTIGKDPVAPGETNSDDSNELEGGDER